MQYGNETLERVYNTIIGPDSRRHCRRVCDPNIRNRIVYTCLHPAGFLDRRELLDNLLELAAFLCATLEFPTPHDSFHPMHNHQQRVDASLDWTDFLNYSLMDVVSVNGTEWRQQQAIPLLQTVRLAMDPSFYLPFVKWPHCRRPRAARDRHRERYGLHIVSKDRDEVLADFDVVRHYSLANNKDDDSSRQSLPFLWEIPTNFYAWHKEFRAHIRETLPLRQSNSQELGAACLPWSRSGRYVQRSYPDTLQQLMDGIWEQVKSASGGGGLIGFLHIRRGDTIEECDTSIGKMRDYLKCSLSNMTLPKLFNGENQQQLRSKEQSINVTVLVGTNEEDKMYIQDLQNMVRELSISTKGKEHTVQIYLHAINMESLIWSYLQTQVDHQNIPPSYLNNLHVFEILDHIMNSRVDFKLSRRRFRFCNACDSIVIRQSARTKT